MLLKRKELNIKFWKPAIGLVAGFFHLIQTGVKSYHRIRCGVGWGFTYPDFIELCKEFGLNLDNNQFDTHLSFEGNYSKAGA